MATLLLQEIDKAVEGADYPAAKAADHCDRTFDLPQELTRSLIAVGICLRP